MKRFVIWTLIFAILSFTTISLFAYNDKAKKTVNKYWADADVDGSSPEKSWREWVKTEGIGFSTTLDTTWTLVNRHRPELSHNAVADVWNFSFSDTQGVNKWRCYLSDDTTCSECN